MRDLIARALLWVLRILLPAHGRHSTTAPQPHPTPDPAPVSPWSSPWSTPTPAHVIERHTPLRGEDIALVRPYVPTGDYDTLNLRLVQRERRTAAVLATLGVDWPYTYDGAPFPASAFATAG